MAALENISKEAKEVIKKCRDYINEHGPQGFETLLVKVFPNKKGIERARLTIWLNYATKEKILIYRKTHRQYTTSEKERSYRIKRNARKRHPNVSQLELI